LRVGFLVDQLAVVMILVVSFVGLMVMIYSLGYMKGEPRFGWFFALLSLFLASMLTLVLADNFLLLYVVWEGVGICSFLLIGFYSNGGRRRKRRRRLS
jgi:NADH-quinone oxidoreductase subunit L